MEAVLFLTLLLLFDGVQLLTILLFCALFMFLLIWFRKYRSFGHWTWFPLFLLVMVAAFYHVWIATGAWPTWALKSPRWTLHLAGFIVSAALAAPLALIQRAMLKAVLAPILIAWPLLLMAVPWHAFVNPEMRAFLDDLGSIRRGMPVEQVERIMADYYPVEPEQLAYPPEEEPSPPPLSHTRHFRAMPTGSKTAGIRFDSEERVTEVGLTMDFGGSRPPQGRRGPLEQGPD